MKELSDAELMELVKGGEFSAFDELYNRYHGPVGRFLFSLTWDQDTAEDYLQEVFLRLFRARNRYEPTGKFSTYIFQIAKNYYLTQRRKERNQRKVMYLNREPNNGVSGIENIRASEKVEPEMHLLREYRRWKIREAIRSLPKGQQMVFVMSHFEGMKYADIAEVLKIPVGTVKSRMFTAVNALKIILGEERK